MGNKEDNPIEHTVFKYNAFYNYRLEMAKKTVTLSFRINQVIVDKLRLESESNHISLNNLTNQILQNYVDWET